jgi:hypothetical protein
MIAYNKNNGNPRERQKDPLGGGYLMPGNCTEVKPPEFNKETHTCSFNGTEWIVKEIPQPEPDPKPEPEPYVETYADKRRKEYGFAHEQIEFITENGIEAWQNRVASIKEKYPKPSE